MAAAPCCEAQVLSACLGVDPDDPVSGGFMDFEDISKGQPESDKELPFKQSVSDDAQADSKKAAPPAGASESGKSGKVQEAASKGPKADPNSLKTAGQSDAKSDSSKSPKDSGPKTAAQDLPVDAPPDRPQIAKSLSASVPREAPRQVSQLELNIVKESLGEKALQDKPLEDFNDLIASLKKKYAQKASQAAQAQTASLQSVNADSKPEKKAAAIAGASGQAADDVTKRITTPGPDTSDTPTPVKDKSKEQLIQDVDSAK